MYSITVFCDGGARGNPGPAAIGVYIEDKNKEEIISIGKKIGNATNNVAEYSAIVEAFDWLIKKSSELKNVSKVYFKLDSQLAYSQLCGLYKVKNAVMRELIFKIREREAILEKEIIYSHIPREENKKADLLVNLALDNIL
jgi:ribonuclease HI